MGRLAAMGHFPALIGLLALAASLPARPNYFHSANLISAEPERGLYVIDSPLGIFTVRYKSSRRRRQPRTLNGAIRISVELSARAGDSLYFLDQDGKEWRGTILDRKPPPPPPPVF
jgi:hypothetical protein